MLSSYQKNLRNRFEEGYGDAKNLRGRHPLAALGFLFIAGADIPETGLIFAIDMLRKLTSEPDVYECACLLIVDGTQGKVDEDESDDRRGPEEESSALVVELGQARDSDDEIETDDEDEPSDGPVSRASRVTLLEGLVPPDLSPDSFFARLIGVALERMPIAVYPDVRANRASPSISSV